MPRRRRRVPMIDRHERSDSRERPSPVGGRLPPAERAARRPADVRASSRRGGRVDRRAHRRVGQTFTLAELAAAYDEADRWLLEVLAGPARAPSSSPWSRTRRSTSTPAAPSTTRHEPAPAEASPARRPAWVLLRRGARGRVRNRHRARPGARRRLGALRHARRSVRTLEPGTQRVQTVTVTVTTAPEFGNGLKEKVGLRSFPPWLILVTPPPERPYPQTSRTGSRSGRRRSTWGWRRARSASGRTSAGCPRSTRRAATAAIAARDLDEFLERARARPRRRGRGAAASS